MPNAVVTATFATTTTATYAHIGAVKNSNSLLLTPPLHGGTLSTILLQRGLRGQVHLVFAANLETFAEFEHTRLTEAGGGVAFASQLKPISTCILAALVILHKTEHVGFGKCLR